jgi:hypothetical protein
MRGHGLIEERHLDVDASTAPSPPNLRGAGSRHSQRCGQVRPEVPRPREDRPDQAATWAREYRGNSRFARSGSWPSCDHSVITCLGFANQVIFSGRLATLWRNGAPAARLDANILRVVLIDQNMSRRALAMPNDYVFSGGAQPRPLQHEVGRRRCSDVPSLCLRGEAQLSSLRS